MTIEVLAACLIIAIADGDTLTALCDEQQQVKVRLAEIDAPEKAQPFGQRSKDSLSRLCYRAEARIDVQTTDRYGRSVARVTCNGVDANAEQVKLGMAWVYDKYVKEKSLYAIQDAAKAGKVGLGLIHALCPPGSGGVAGSKCNGASLVFQRPDRRNLWLDRPQSYARPEYLSGAE